jgi:hypothetical protein
MRWLRFGRRRASAAAETVHDLDAYIELLRNHGWSVRLRDGSVALTLNDAFTRRHPRIPDGYLRFLERVASCVNSDETVWFLCADDYNGTNSDPEWAWDEFEKMVLEDEQDEEVRREVAEFWDNDLPFMYSVGGEYAFLALRVTGDKFGSVVDGFELQTEVSDVAPTFEDFVRLHGAAVRGDPGKTVLGDYV